MKLLSLFLASSWAQDAASDKWVGYDYGSYGSYGGGDLDAKFIYEDQENVPMGRMGNSLFCFTCHGRLRAGVQESTSDNAWMDCVMFGGIDSGAAMDMECSGDERSCLTEERRRYDITVEVKTGCKNPEACMYQWRRNERYMPGFHFFADQTESATPVFFDDECQNTANMKFPNGQRAQWESTCRHCCAALDSGSAGCNGPTGTAPIGVHCQASAGCGTALDSSTMFSFYSISHIPGFMDTLLAFNRAHPGEGRNSLPTDKFIQRKDDAGVNLMEQADRLSTEDVDFHNNRATLAGTNGAFGSK
jgi:hypothetical protein